MRSVSEHGRESGEFTWSIRQPNREYAVNLTPHARSERRSNTLDGVPPPEVTTAVRAPDVTAAGLLPA
jgi:hypothetical protein